MTNPNLTHLLVIVDRSGSMSWNNADKEMAKALNDYFKTQSEVEGECLVDYWQFDNVPEKVFTDKPVSLSEAVIEPRYSTALLDAIGIAGTEFGKKLASKREEDRPGTVQVVIVTDGGENSSRTWNSDNTKKFITDQTNKYGWDFVFLGANIDAVNVAGNIGIIRDNAIQFDINNPVAVGAASAALSSYTTTYRGTGKGGNFTESDRAATMGNLTVDSK